MKRGNRIKLSINSTGPLERQNRKKGKKSNILYERQFDLYRYRSANGKSWDEEAIDDDLLEFEFEDGLVRFVTVEEYRRLSGQTRSLDGKLEISGWFPEASTSFRGQGGFFAKTVTLIRTVFDEKQGEDKKAAIKKGIEEVEEMRNLGLFQWTGKDEWTSEEDAWDKDNDKGTAWKRLISFDDYDNQKKIEKVRAAIADAAGVKPILILIHGTNSSTQGSFGELASHSQWADFIRNNYQTTKTEDQKLKDAEYNVYAFEHKTFSVNPVENAVALMQLLPGNIDVDLLTHSRGGLVGEFLCILSQGGNTSQSVNALVDNDLEVEARDIHVRKFVRVACPAAGTDLLSDKMETSLTISLNLLGLIPGLKINPFYQIARQTLIHAIKAVRNDVVMPGIEVMSPRSKMVAFLNSGQHSLQSKLFVVSGSATGGGVIRRMYGWLFSELTMGTHDLVVHSASMERGADRTSKPVVLYDRGSDVSHFNYFRNKESFSFMIDSLSSPFSEVEGSSEKTFQFDSARGTQKITSVNFPKVIIVADCFGSTLKKGSDDIWVESDSVSRLFHYTDVDVKTDLIPEVYCPIYNFLSRHGLKVKRFSYDWRQDRTKHLDQFCAEIGEEEVVILAHGSGGLLALEAIYSAPETAKKVKRIILAGTPFKGYPGLRKESVALFNQLISMLQPEGVEAGSGGSDVGNSIANFAGVKELTDVFSHAVDVEKVYIAGQADYTPTQKENTYSSKGDGRVTWDSIPQDISAYWFENTPHGNLLSNPGYFAAILDLIREGKTELAPMEAPLERGIDHHINHSTEPPVFPGKMELLQAGMGYDQMSSLAEEAEQHIVEIEVVHGDLFYSRAPVVVGHYKGDFIVNAEAALDRSLGGKLSELYHLGIYPGDIGTAKYVQSAKGKGIIIGLGQVGELSPETISRSFTAGLLEYAYQMASERNTGKSNFIMNSLEVSTLQVGTATGGIPHRDSLSAIMRGVVIANEQLKRSPLGQRYRIGKLNILDLFLDKAVEALQSLEHIFAYSSLGNQFKYKTHVRSASGGKKRIAFFESQDWWIRIRVKSDPSGEGLNFTVFADSAKVEALLSNHQKDTIENYIHTAIQQKESTEIPATLYELLLPNRLKKQIPNGRSIVLILDQQSAAYPWELLLDREEQSGLPVAVRSGMIRQLELVDFESHPETVTTDSALIIGDPELGWMKKSMPQLKGAREESEAVQSKLSSLFGESKVQALIGKTSESCMSALMTGDFRILHVAAHGIHGEWIDIRHRKISTESSEDGQPYTGIVLGDGRIFTANEIKHMRRVPELAFINCCHLGKNADADEHHIATQGAHKFAADFGVELIKAGVRAVVVAGWPVADGPAKEFAEIFYSRMQAGDTFGEAVNTARRSIYEKYHQRTNTWGAYQCYGDPGYKMVRSNPEVYQSENWEYLCAPEAASDLANMVAEAKTVSNQEVIKIKLQQRLPKIRKFESDAEIISRLGDLHRVLDDFSTAEDYYRRALAIEKADVPIRTVERLANTMIRGAILNKELSREDFDLEAAAAEKYLIRLLDMSVTSERYSLLSSYHMRMAYYYSDVAKDPVAFRKHLLWLIWFAYCAHKFNLDRKGRLMAYPTMKWLTSLAVMQKLNFKEKIVLDIDPQYADVLDFPDETEIQKAFNADLDEVHGLIRQLRADSETKKRSGIIDYWNEILEPEIGILEILYDQDGSQDEAISNKRKKKIINLYQMALLHASAVQLRSLKEMLGYFGTFPKEKSNLFVEIQNALFP